MNALILTIFVSLVLVFGALIFFGWLLRHHVFSHSDRLALLPLENEETNEPPVLDSTDEKS